MADGHSRPVVHAENSVAGKLIEQPFFDHDSAATFVLFGGLKDDVDRAGEIP